ncbi:nucleotide exchange factor GrpE [Candidatus Neptunochlamydia vexilliferae]|uniref:Protein GrpE n=1 Tax=Candidatus Neptunichlamydia vexilliferae TaxID=1651774 RepID=A0ABS0AXR9_9BACT|nr:nucleotide exchange factor GrpE [Candidatus Neptunochlamydia vexilliferae]MBF5058928.1 Protein GrpE [Candidatus Neptunochlamydia vexilliferae]
MDEEPQETTNKEEVIDETELLKKQIKEEQEKYLRSLADMENSRKRMQKEKHDVTRFAVENVIGEFLSPLDNFENAMSFIHQASEETQNWAKGFEMILTQFKDILSAHKVTSYTSEGHQFDPHLHEVLEIEETEKHEDGMIIQEFVKGYKCGDRVLRPARVKVAKAPAQEEEKEDQQEEENNGE